MRKPAQPTYARCAWVPPNRQRRCRMVSTAWARRKSPRSLPGLCGALGLCGLAFLAALSVSVGAQKAGGERQREPAEEAAPKPEEAPTGFDNKTNGLEDQHAFDKDRAKFEE